MGERDEVVQQVAVMVERPKHGGRWMAEAEGRWRHRLRGDVIHVGESGEIVWCPPNSDPPNCKLFGRAELKSVLDVIAKLSEELEGEPS